MRLLTIRKLGKPQTDDMHDTNEARVDLEALKSRYDVVLERIQAACSRASRPDDAVSLIAVSKTFTVSHVEALYSLGHRDFGENKAQELSEKAKICTKRGFCPDIRWHMIGHLQRNKARDTVRTSALLHSLDNERLARELNRRAERAGRRLECLVQVNISGEASKSGVDPETACSFVESISTYQSLRICGLMGMARLSPDPESVREEFRLLRSVRDACDVLYRTYPDLPMLSMGMSQDFEVAIEEGATHVRIGSAIFGPRAPLATASGQQG